MAAKYAALNAKVEYIAWVEEELIPLLIDAYGKPVRYWRQAAKNAEQSVGKLVSDLVSHTRQSRSLLTPCRPAGLRGLRLHSGAHPPPSSQQGHPDAGRNQRLWMASDQVALVCWHLCATRAQSWTISAGISG